MYIPTTTTLLSTSPWLGLYPLSTGTPAAIPHLAYRQGAIIPSLSGPIWTSVPIINPHLPTHPSNTISSAESYRTSSKTSTLPSSLVATALETISSTLLARSSSTTSITVHVTTSKSKTTSSVSSTSLLAPTTETESVLPTSTKASSAYRENCKRIVIITGILAGSIVGAIIIGLLIYWLYAYYLGVNVCNCCGSCCERRYKDDQNNDAQPPVMLYPMSGIGAAPRINNVPRPVAPPPRVVENSVSRLHRKVPGSHATQVW